MFLFFFFLNKRVRSVVQSFCIHESLIRDLYKRNLQDRLSITLRIKSINAFYHSNLRTSSLPPKKKDIQTQNHH